MKQLIFLSMCGALVWLAGCGREGPPLGEVSGTVTLDGQPLPRARVVFQPEQRGRSPSVATTNAEGKYELMYNVGQKGAMPGRHKVSITTYRQEHNPDGPAREIPERVPPQYNADSTLVEDVTSGSQEINFQLEGALAP